MRITFDMTLEREGDEDAGTPDQTIEATITAEGSWAPAEPDVGYFQGYWEDVGVTARDENDKVIALTDAEEQRAIAKAEEKLTEQRIDDDYERQIDAYESRYGD